MIKVKRFKGALELRLDKPLARTRELLLAFGVERKREQLFGLGVYRVAQRHQGARVQRHAAGAVHFGAAAFAQKLAGFRIKEKDTAVVAAAVYAAN